MLHTTQPDRPSFDKLRAGPPSHRLRGGLVPAFAGM